MRNLKWFGRKNWGKTKPKKDLLLLQILSNPHKYAKAVKIQRMFNQTNRYNKFKIEAGVSEEQIQRVLAVAARRDTQDLILEYRLGEAGTYSR